MSTEQGWFPTDATLLNATAASTASITVRRSGTLDVLNTFAQVSGAAINAGLTASPLITLGITRTTWAAPTTRTVGTINPGVGITVTPGSNTNNYANLAGVLPAEGIQASSGIGVSFQFRPAFGGLIKYPGTVTTASASPNVTGVGTSFTRDFIVGDIILINGVERVVITITSDTAIVTNANWGVVNTAVSYRNGQASAPGDKFNDAGIGSVGSGKIRVIKNDVIVATVVQAGVGGTVAGSLRLLASLALDPN
jgi:hypothetical protein